MIARDFRTWCGDEKFAKFVRTLQTTSREKGRLTYSQEQTWREFASAKGLELPCELETVNAILANVLCVPHQLEIVLLVTVDTLRPLLRERLLDWAEQRTAVGLDLNASVVVRCTHEATGYARNVIDATFFEDREVNRRFLGATITGSVQSLPPNESVAGFAFIVSASDGAERGRLGWVIERRE